MPTPALHSHAVGLAESDFNQRLSALYDTLSRQARAILDVHDVEDVVQEAVMAMWEKRDRYRADSNFAGWAYTCLRNTCLDHVRSPGTFRRSVVLVESYDNLPATPVQPLIVEGDEAAELGEQLRQLMELYLPPDLSLVLKLELKGYTHDEIAQVLGLHRNTALARAQEARELLRQYVTQGETQLRPH